MADQLSDHGPDASNAPEVAGKDGQQGGVDEKPQVSGKPSNMMPLHAPPPKRKGCKGRPCIGDCMQKPPNPTLGVEDLKDPQFGRMLGAEYVGTMFLVFIGCLSCITSSPGTQPNPNPSGGNVASNPVGRDDNNDLPFWFIDEDGSNHTYYKYTLSPNTLHVSLAFGFVIATMAQAVGHISGAHLNPAVSFGLMIAGKCSFLKVLCYTVAQCLGSLTGALLVWLTSKNLRVKNDDYKPNGKIATFHDMWPNWGMGASVLSRGVSQFPDGMMTEFTLTFLLVFTIISVCDDLRKDVKGSAVLAIGLAAFCSHAAGIAFTGSSINPARSFGPAIFSSAPNRWVDHWVYWIGPLLGAFEAGFIYSSFFRARPPPVENRHVSPESIAP